MIQTVQVIVRANVLKCALKLLHVQCKHFKTRILSMGLELACN